MLCKPSAPSSVPISPLTGHFPHCCPSTLTSPPLDHSLLLLEHALPWGSGEGWGRWLEELAQEAQGGPAMPLSVISYWLNFIHSTFYTFSLWSGFLWGLLVQQRYLNIHWLQMLFTAFLLHWVHQEICLDTAASNS